jgi:Sugar phosphate permease
MEKTEGKKLHYAWFVLIACLGFYSVLVGICCNTAGIFLAPVMKEFNWTRTAASEYLSIWPLVAAVSQPIAGKLMQKYNPRYLLTAAVALFCVAYMWTSTATQVWQWNVFGVIYGLTATFFMYLAVPVLINVWFKKNVGFNIGLAAAALSLVAAFSAPIAQSIITAYGWQTARLYLGIAAFIFCVPVTFIFVRKNPEEMGLKQYGADEVVVEEETGASKWNVDYAVPVKRAVTNPAFYLILLMACVFTLTATFFQQIPTYAAKGPLGAAAGAMAVSIVMVGGICGKFIIGYVSDHWGSTVAATFACICGAVGVFMAFKAGGNLGVFYVGMAIFGIGYAALSVINPMLTKQSFGVKYYPEIYSYIIIVIFLMSSAGPLMYARIYDLTGGFTLAFIIVTCIYIVGAVAVQFVRPFAKKTWTSNN